MNKTYFFWLGWLSVIAYQQTIQDIVGKERYIEIVKVGWINTPWWIWPIALLFFLGVGFLSEWVNSETRKRNLTRVKLLKDAIDTMKGKLQSEPEEPTK